MFNKDGVVKFLETVTYDQVMAYNYILSVGDSQREFLLQTANNKYNWTNDELQFLGTLINFHCVGVAYEDWRFNYFWAITMNLPEKVLEEQFPTLKKLGDKLVQLKRNALVYKNRMLEIIMVQDSITSMYPLIHLEDSSIELPEITCIEKTVVWQNSSSRTVRFIKETIEYHFNELMAYSPTPDLKEKFSTGASGRVEIIKFMNQIKIMGMHGAIDLTNSKLSAV